MTDPGGYVPPSEPGPWLTPARLPQDGGYDPFSDMTPDERADALRRSMPPDLAAKMDELVAEALRIVANDEDDQ